MAPGFPTWRSLALTCLCAGTPGAAVFQFQNEMHRHKSNRTVWDLLMRVIFLSQHSADAQVKQNCLRLCHLHLTFLSSPPVNKAADCFCACSCMD